MENKLSFLYVVTSYGCDSTPSDMWIPKSKLFTSFEEAYTYFVKVSPDLHDKENLAKQYINPLATNSTDSYVVIENRVQLPGYYENGGNYAKRPSGAVLARIYL